MAKYEFVYLGRGDSSCYGTCPVQRHGTSVTTSNVSGMYGELSEYFDCLLEDGIVCDKRPCFENNREAATAHVFRGPMLNIEFPPGHIQQLFEDVRPIKTGERIGSVDHVSMDIYLNGWRKLGAKIGVRKDNFIVWEDGMKDNIKR